MAATKRNASWIEATRQKIQASQLINRLMAHVLGEVEMTNSQVRAAQILLAKRLPDLSSVELSGEVAHRHVMRAPSVAATADEWQHQHTPTTIQ